jgi:hypothetical protein
MEVTLKVNMIIGGRHYPFGTVLDEEEVPNHLRTPEYITDIDGVPNIQGNEEFMLEEPGEEEDEPRRLVKKAPMVRRKPFGRR